MNTLLTIALGLIVSVVSGKDPLVVSTRQGAVRGQYAETRGGRRYTQFLGIPYAKPPTGALRFKSPVSADRWDSVLNATTECSDCIQQYVLIESVRTVVSGSEDCLCLNIFTPSTTTTKLPVIVFVHGGAYVGGSGTAMLYGGDLMIDEDVVLVTFNYRLGAMGFLSTGDEVIPGNFGMKDQAHVLKWVKQNIQNFGGDPNSVTLMGESAGATSASLHQYSPLSKGLFQKAIQNSGSALNPWSMVKQEVLKGRTAVVAEVVGCPSSQSVTLLTCLQQAPAEAIVNTTHMFLIWDFDPLVIWGPTVEVSSVRGAFLTTHPKSLVRASKTPLLTGLNAAEGGLKTTTVVGSMAEQKFSHWNRDYYTLTPISLMINGSGLDSVDTLRAIRRFYFGSDVRPITPHMLQQITNMYGDIWFKFGILDEAEARLGPTFLYHYNYNKSFSACPLILLGAATPYLGACHFDELTNLFPIQSLAPKFNQSSPDYFLSVKMVKMWTNFAKTSNPSTKEIIWKPVQSKALEHLEITNSGISMKSNLLKERRKFWKSITFKRKNIPNYWNISRSKLLSFVRVLLFGLSSSTST